MASEKDLNKGVVVQDHRDWDGYRRSNHLVNWSLELVDEISFCHRVFVRGSTIYFGSAALVSIFILLFSVPSLFL
jgi:hypothetical protein